jgi:hypothetical protein
MPRFFRLLLQGFSADNEPSEPSPQLRGLYRTLKALGAGGTGRNHNSAATGVIMEERLGTPIFGRGPLRSNPRRWRIAVCLRRIL